MEKLATSPSTRAWTVPAKAAVGAAALLLGIAIYQVALAAGVSWGEASYGGRADTVDGVLPDSYRAMSAAAAAILAFAAWIVAARGQLVGRGFVGPRFLEVATWVIAVYLAVNTVMNATAEHLAERFILGAVTLTAAALSLIVASRAPRESDAHVS